MIFNSEYAYFTV